MHNTVFNIQAAKNHGVILPDANKEATLSALVGAAFGAAGQRCMALSTVIWVGEARKWIPEVVERARKLRVNGGTMSMLLVHYFIAEFCPKMLRDQFEYLIFTRI